tara:strand:- start:18202 stop:18891 length:690 start_codon:yes stop_codon:yes gene_type:complete
MSLALLGAIQAAGQIGYGAYQQRQAKNLQKKLGPQPIYDFDYAKRGVAGQLNLAQGEAPGLTQQLQGVNQNVANTTQNIANMAPSGAAGLGALVGVNANANQSYADIIGQGAMTKQGLMQNYLQGLGGLQGYGDKAYETNQLAPYLQQQEKITQLQGAGNENIGGGIASGFETIGSSIAANSVGDLTTQAVSLKGLNLSETSVLEAIAGLSPTDPTYKLYKTAYPQYVK